MASSGAGMGALLIELWSERPAWQAMDRAAREAFMAKVDAELAPVRASGITLLAAADLVADAPQGSRHIAIWRAETEEDAAAFRAALARAGWYAMFDQTDLVGHETALAEILARHVSGHLSAHLSGPGSADGSGRGSRVPPGPGD